MPPPGTPPLLLKGGNFVRSSQVWLKLQAPVLKLPKNLLCPPAPFSMTFSVPPPPRTLSRGKTSLPPLPFCSPSVINDWTLSFSKFTLAYLLPRSHLGELPLTLGIDIVWVHIVFLMHNIFTPRVFPKRNTFYSILAEVFTYTFMFQRILDRLQYCKAYIIYHFTGLLKRYLCD